MYGDKLTRLIEILSLQAESRDIKAQAAIAEAAIELYEDTTGDHSLNVEVDAVGNYFITKGEADLYPSVVAHLDQVHDYNDTYKILEQDGVLFGWDGIRQVGTGGDDLVGVWLAVECLISQPILKVAFFVDEEIGCIGSGKADVSFFSDCAFILQGDRNNATNDWVRHTNGVDVTTEAFDTMIEPILDRHDYKFADGTLTDVGELLINGAGCCASNIACGYHFAHTDAEIVITAQAMNCLDLMEEVIAEMGGTRWEIETPIPYYGQYYGGRGWGSNVWTEAPKKKVTNKDAEWDAEWSQDELSVFEGMAAWEDNGVEPCCDNCESEEPMEHYPEAEAFYCHNCGHGISETTFSAINI